MNNQMSNKILKVFLEDKILHLHALGNIFDVEKIVELLDGITIAPSPEPVSKPIRINDDVQMFTIKTMEYGDVVIHLCKDDIFLNVIKVNVLTEDGIYIYDSNKLSFYSNLSIGALKELKIKEAELRKHNKPVYDKYMSKIKDENFYKLDPMELYGMFDSVGLNPNFEAEITSSIKSLIEEMRSQYRERGLNYNLATEIEHKTETVNNHLFLSDLVKNLCVGLSIEPNNVSYGIYTPHGDKSYFNIVTTDGQKINFFEKQEGGGKDFLTASFNTAEGTYIYQNGEFSFYDNAAYEELKAKEKYVEAHWSDKWKAMQERLEQIYAQMPELKSMTAYNIMDSIKTKTPSFDPSNLLSSTDPDVIVESFKCVGIEPSFVLGSSEKKTFVNAMKRREEVYSGANMKF